ncbi:Protein of unknown function [Ferrimonas sediminum]|uniref:DUF2955 domain-containing protein n=1 Tax=Ferrimonas sediminum TaxID=718193 RepID=A0A1G8T7H9_9GAMM|nr:DUF2955 domain-containing protein [Ferrimonas sediminum]SDJ37433.1 Protein of unknown function [Ferrimonas sediminum]
MNQTTDWNEVGRIAGTVTLCMLAGRYLHLGSPVYLALFPILSVTKARDYRWSGLIKMFLPVVVSATLALLTVELFSDHPFIVWSLSLLGFDQLRRRATTPAKLGGMILPTFNWILIVVFAQQPSFVMADRIREIALSLVITIVVMKAMNGLFPRTSQCVAAGPPPQPVGHRDRFWYLLLLGGGLAFLMIVDMISATFCMVPVIIAAAQTRKPGYLAVIRARFIAQVGGCALAMVFQLLLLGHQHLLPLYSLSIFVLVLTLAWLIGRSQGAEKELHGDALLGIALPIQLYMGTADIGLQSTFLRGWQLSVTLFLLLALSGLIYGRTHHDTEHHLNHRTG